MFKKIRKHSILLAVLLQAFPICRPLFTAPSALPSFAIISQWLLGAGITLGTSDAVSGATTVYYTTPTNFSGSVGTYFTNFVAITNNGGDPGAFFVLTNTSGISPSLKNGQSTTVCMPPGLTFKCVDLNNGGSPKLIYGAMYGTPTTAMTNYRVHLLAGYQSLTPAQTNIFFTFTTASRPTISTPPTGVTNVAGGPATFSVVAAGTGQLAYQWRFNGVNAIANATNSAYSISHVRLSDAGDYSVVVTNNGGAITSSPAYLSVTLPSPPKLSVAAAAANRVTLTFNPVAGLTNTLESEGSLSGAAWTPLTNIPPPPGSTSMTVTDSITVGAKFYRLNIRP